MSQLRDLQEDFYLTGTATRRLWFRWLAIGRIITIAADPRKLLIAVLALVFLSAADFLVVHQGQTTSVVTASDQPSPLRTASQLLPAWLVQQEFLLNGHVGQLAQSITSTSTNSILLPFTSTVLPAINTLRDVATGELGWRNPAMTLLAFIIWSFFGGIICRLAAVEFASGERTGLLSSWRYGLRKVKGTLFGMLLIVLLMALLIVMNWCFGLITAIPYFGTVWGSVLGFLPLLFSVIVVLGCLLLFAGWPVKMGAVAVDGADGIDALSRTVNYLVGHVPYYLWLWFYALVVSLLAAFFVGGVSQAVNLTFVFSTSNSADIVTGEFTIHLLIWQSLLGMLTLGYGVSLCWSAATAIYFLLRLREDALPLNVYYRDQPQTESDQLPLVGDAERKRHETEREQSESSEQATVTS